MGKWQKKYKTKQKVNTYLSKHFKKMKVKFKEKPNIEEKKVNLEEATLSNTSVIRPVCVCVCVWKVQPDQFSASLWVPDDSSLWERVL